MYQVVSPGRQCLVRYEEGAEANRSPGAWFAMAPLRILSKEDTDHNALSNTKLGANLFRVVLIRGRFGEGLAARGSDYT